MKLKGNMLFPLILLGFAFYLLTQVLSYPLRSQVFPFLLGILPLIILSIVQLVTEWKSSGRLPTEDTEAASMKRLDWKKTTVVFAWLVFFLVLVAIFGFLLAIPLFSLLFLKVFWKERWSMTFILTLITAATIYGLFVTAFHISLYKGMLFQ